MTRFEFAVVSEQEAQIKPYPYVYVEEDGSCRELLAGERMYLQERFHPGDGGRPYVKRSYESLTPDGKILGFCARKYIPQNILIVAASED
ncbi:hypothetical protein [Marinicella sp. W31]|uniref:hypothetical protein n=1 Tax=Marinicella sp. W31 TaxID=3023713 RepID=UPI0037565ADD